VITGDHRRLPDQATTARRRPQDDQPLLLYLSGHLGGALRHRGVRVSAVVLRGAQRGQRGAFTGPIDDPRVVAIISVIIGIVLAVVILSLTGYYTGTEDRPVKDVGKTSLTGAATVVLAGISVGLESAVYTAVVIGAAVYSAFLIGGSGVVALFAIALAGCGLLTTVGVIVAMDTFGPVSDNAQGIAEMSGDVHGEGLPDPHRAGRGGQHHQGHHQGHRHRHRGAGRHRAVRFLHRRHPHRVWATGTTSSSPRPWSSTRRRWSD
jgi:hypothetical protein